MNDDPLEQIRRQIVAAEQELHSYPPTSVDWFTRCLTTAENVIPALCGIAPDLLGFCEEVYNSPDRVRKLWEQFKKQRGSDQVAEKLDKQLAREQVLIKEIAGDVVSRIMTDYILGDPIGKHILSNGRSDYPDLYLANYDYSQLPRFDRKTNKEYGAAVKGKKLKPVRVPDGIEIKTCRNSFRVDCHYDHMGLHIALFYREIQGTAQMTDLLAAFLRREDYTVSKSNTNTTTVKASFNARRFISLTPGGCAMGQVKGLVRP
jgi:hypothetical protein